MIVVICRRINFGRVDDLSEIFKAMFGLITDNCAGRPDLTRGAGGNSDGVVMVMDHSAVDPPTPSSRPGLHSSSSSRSRFRSVNLGIEISSISTNLYKRSTD